METAETKTLAQMIAEVVEVNTANGWYEKEVSFGEAMALMHSEVSEALEAWRRWGLDDATAGEINVGGHPMAPVNPKPEGVGSEFADIFIRLLDYAYRFGQLHLDAMFRDFHGAFGLNESFPENMDTLHTLIAKTSMLRESGEPEFGSITWRSYMVRILVFLRQLCDHYGIDLAAEYERKLAFNRTRGYRHGNKPI